MQLISRPKGIHHHLDYMEDSGTFTLTLKVTRLQRDTIHQLFNHSGWEFNEVTNDSALNNSTQDSDEDDVPPFVIQQNDEAVECVYCWCKPCITSECYRQLWWETENTAADGNNHSLRKPIYYRFWTMLFHRQVWKDPRYVAKKATAIRQKRQKRKLVWHRRDIMPDCVVKLVRRWYPNPINLPYMGHLWE
jgi:hypothetical protein